MVLAVDIDGILTVETAGFNYAARTPNIENISRINTISIDHTIILYTARWSCDRDITEKWLADNGVLYNELVFDKLKYDMLLDDLCTSSIDDFQNIINKIK